MVKKNLIIIIPAYNEEKTIAKVIKRIPSFADLNKRVIVVNDGSLDNTAIVAKKAGATVISNKQNLGLGKTFKIGLKYSLRNSADIIVILDSDGQYDSKNIRRLILPILNNEADLTIGNRFIFNSIYDINFIKKLGNKILSIFISKLLLKINEIYDVQSSFRAFNRKLGRVLNNELVAKYNYAQEMFILSWLYEFKVKQISVDCFRRISGKSKLIKNSILHLLKIIWISFRTIYKIKIRIYSNK